MATIYIHPQFHTAPLMSSEIRLEVLSAVSLGDLIRDACGADKKMLFRIMDERGGLRPHVAVFIGSEHCKYLGGLDAEVDPQAEVSIYPALSGG